jgi:ABC-type polysaccharide/polyol phosphate export permease
MFEERRATSDWVLLIDLLDVTYHTSVRKVRMGHRNAVVAIGMSVLQSVLFVAAFYLMFSLLGAQTTAIRGEFTLYLLSGIFLYLVHVQTLQKVVASETAASPLMQHAPMNTLVAILSSAILTLYIKTISLLVILFFLHTILQPVVIHDWGGALMMYLLAWGSGAAIGLLFMALKPWAPDVIPIVQTVYVRANMIASGKLFVANMLPGFMIALFDWNPLFHIIDQMRGFVFVNYVPHYTTWQYPVFATLGLVLLGMMLEFHTRKHASASWAAGR